MSESPQVYPFKRQKESKKEVMSKNIAKHFPKDLILLGIAGFLLSRGEILGGLYPFAPAFLGAVLIAYRQQGLFYLLPVLLGLYSALDGVELLTYGSIIVLLAFILLIYPVDGKKQWIVVPSLVFASVAVVKALMLSITGITNYLLMVAGLESLFAAGLTVVFLILFNACKKLELHEPFSADEIICSFVFCMAVISGVGAWSLFNIQLQSVFSCIFILIAAYVSGAGVGAGVGAITGIVPSLSSIVPPSIVGTYAFSGLLAGSFRSFGRLGVLMGFILGKFILSLYVLDGTQITDSLLSALVGGIVFLAVPKSVYKKLSFVFGNMELKSAKEEQNQRALRMCMRKLRNAEWVFKELSNTLTNFTKQEENSEEDHLNAVLNNFYGQVCAECSMKQICWEFDHKQTCNSVIEMFKIMDEKGKMTVKDVPDNFSKRCPHLKELTILINCMYDLTCRTNYWQSQKKINRELLTSELTGVAEILNNLAKSISSYNKERELLEKSLTKAILARGVAAESTGVVSMTDRGVDLCMQYASCPGEDKCRALLEDEVSGLLGKNYVVHECTCGMGMRHEKCSYRLLEAGAKKLVLGKAQLAKDGKGLCGDCGGSVLLEEGKQMLMISDGMGVGSRAAFESNNSLLLISRLLEAGFQRDTAINILNGVLALRETKETFVTLDLCILDLYSGEAEFIKTGACPSFIKRLDTTISVAGSSLPIGMIASVEKQVSTEYVKIGDMVIMASDGLFEADKKIDLQWLTACINNANITHPQELAEYLLSKAISISKGKLRDDITVLVGKIIA